MRRGFVIAIFVMLAGLSGWRLPALWPFGAKSVYSGVRERMLARLEADPDLAARLEARMSAACGWPRALRPIFCADAIGEAEADIAHKGVTRLDRDTQVRRIALMNEVLAIADEKTCEAISTMKARPAQLAPVFEKLPQASLDAWEDMGFIAIAAELRGAPPERVDKADVEAAQHVFQAGVPAKDRGRMMVAAATRDFMTDDQACWAGKAIYGRIAEMPEPHRGVLAVYVHLPEPAKR